MPIVIAGTVPIRPERRDDAIRAARAMVAATRSEPGCIAYRFATDVADPNLVLVFEEWKDDESLKRHFETPHMATFQQEVPGFLAGVPSFTRYVVASSGPLSV